MISLGLIVIGAMFIVYGGIVMESFHADMPGMFANLPSRHAVWMLFVGTIATFAGLLAEVSVVRPVEA